MSDSVTIPTISGTIDGKVPVYNPGGRFQRWSIDQIFTGTHGENKYVPNVRDIVENVETGDEWIVESIDEVTLKAKLVARKRNLGLGGISEEDVLIGVGPGEITDTFRIYVDKSVRPFTMAVDARCMLAGDDLSSYQICKGSEVDGTLRVISTHYDQGGTYLGNVVPLKLAAMRDHSNYAIYAIPTCTTTEELVDNDVVEMRVYSVTGGLRARYRLLVENTSFIHLTDAAQKYVTHISLDTPFLSNTDPHLIEYPLNVNLSGVNLFGVVHYSDGTTLRMPVDGTKFQIFGLDNFIASTVGERAEPILQYNLSNDEVHYGSTVGLGRSLQQNYTSISTKEDGSYTVKLFAYPQWVDEVNGYRMEYFLFNLDRRTWQRVTSFVQYNSNLPAFNPRLYGINQQLSVSIDLSKVNPSYKKWTHVQVIDVTLFRNATDHSDTPWTVAYERNQLPPYGQSSWAKVTHVSANVRRVNISNGETTLANWLNKFYHNTKPLYSPSREVKAPEPNMFALEIGDKKFEFTIDKWNTELSVSAAINSEDTVFVRFFKRNTDGDLQLAMAGLPVIWLNSRI